MSRIAIILIFILCMVACFLPPEKEIPQISQEQTIADKSLMDIYVSHKSKQYLNPDLKKFRLKWTIDSKIIKYQYRSASVGKIF